MSGSDDGDILVSSVVEIMGIIKVLGLLPFFRIVVILIAVLIDIIDHIIFNDIMNRILRGNIICDLSIQESR